MKFRYIGADQTEWFGFEWHEGQVHDVTDEHAIRKLTNSVLFERVEEQSKPVLPPKLEEKIEEVLAETQDVEPPQMPEPRRRGRPPKVHQHPKYDG